MPVSAVEIKDTYPMNVVAEQVLAAELAMYRDWSEQASDAFNVAYKQYPLETVAVPPGVYPVVAYYDELLTYIVELPEGTIPYKPRAVRIYLAENVVRESPRIFELVRS